MTAYFLISISVALDGTCAQYNSSQCRGEVYRSLAVLKCHGLPEEESPSEGEKLMKL